MTWERTRSAGHGGRPGTSPPCRSLARPQSETAPTGNRLGRQGQPATRLAPWPRTESLPEPRMQSQ